RVTAADPLTLEEDIDGAIPDPYRMCCRCGALARRRPWHGLRAGQRSVSRPDHVRRVQLRAAWMGRARWTALVDCAEHRAVRAARHAVRRQRHYDLRAARHARPRADPRGAGAGPDA